MQPKDVTAYGCDYSAREFTPEELRHYPGVRIEWLGRYIGYPGNPKCISHYPGAYRRHRDAGIAAVLFHQIEYRDFEGGYAQGQAHARTALQDALQQGWAGETPIIACFDRRMPAFTRNGVTYRAIPLNEVRDYVKGFVSIVGYENSGFYGFEDTMGPCVRENWVRFTMQCGARSAHIPGISAWQENNEQPRLLGTQTDRLELYIKKAALAGNQQNEEEPMYAFDVQTIPAQDGSAGDVAEAEIVWPPLDGATGLREAWVSGFVPAGATARFHFAHWNSATGERINGTDGANYLEDEVDIEGPAVLAGKLAPDGAAKLVLVYDSTHPIKFAVEVRD